VTSFSQAIQTGTTTSRPLRFQNLGNAPLQWSATATLPGAGVNITTFETSSQNGGPAYGWIDISSGATTIWAPTGSNTNDDENKSFNFPAGFSFPFYGGNFTAVNVCSNGFVHFGGTAQTNFTNNTLPSAGSPANMIAAAWTDWVVDSQSWVKWKAVDADRVVITWNNVLRYGLTTRATFQLILKRSGEILVQVQAFGPTNRIYTVGIQNAARSAAVLASFNPATNFIPTGSGINFAVRFPVPVVTPTWLAFQLPSGSVNVSSTGETQLVFNASGLAAGSYNAVVEIQSNDPGEPSLAVPVTLVVGNSQVPPNAPTSLTASAGAVVTLAWQLEGGGNTGHRAEYRILGAPAWTPGPGFGANATTGVISSLAPGTSYEFRLFATGPAGDSGASNIASVATWSAIKSWRYLYFSTIENSGDASDMADPDHDSIPNLLEYALLGGHPLESSIGILPVSSLTTDNGSQYLTLTVAKNPAATDISYTVETCGDLATWNHGSGHTVIVQETANSLIVRDAIPLGGVNPRFIHLKVIGP
jgi:hypothetical protein